MKWFFNTGLPVSVDYSKEKHKKAEIIVMVIIF